VAAGNCDSNYSSRELHDMIQAAMSRRVYTRSNSDFGRHVIVCRILVSNQRQDARKPCGQKANSLINFSGAQPEWGG
jgi:hypothetical protein